MITIVSKSRFFLSITTLLTLLISISIWLLYASQDPELSKLLSNPVIQIALAVFGIILSILGFLKKETVLRLFGMIILGSIPTIRLVAFGVGGSGKTTLFNSLFEIDSKTPEKTLVLSENDTTVRHNNRDYRVLTIDYEGQKERRFREHLRSLHDSKEEVNVLFFLLSFFPVLGDNKQLSIPRDKDERVKIINEHCDDQTMILNIPIIDEIITYCHGLHTVCVLINQMDTLTHIPFFQRIKFASDIFGKVIERVDEVVRHHQERDKKIEFLVSHISAKDGTLIDKTTGRKVGLTRILERILIRQESFYGRKKI